MMDGHFRGCNIQHIFPASVFGGSFVAADFESLVHRSLNYTKFWEDIGPSYPLPNFVLVHHYQSIDKFL